LHSDKSNREGRHARGGLFPAAGKREEPVSRKILVVLAVAMVLGLMGFPSTSWSRGGSVGSVRACDLTGVNPAKHGLIFKHPDVAKSYGFEKGPDGTWRVMANCQTTGPK
jgi:hypothetical protein